MDETALDDTPGTPEHAPPQFLVWHPPGEGVLCDTVEEAREIAMREARDNPGAFIDVYQHAGAMRFRDEAPENDDANG